MSLTSSDILSAKATVYNRNPISRQHTRIEIDHEPSIRSTPTARKEGRRWWTRFCLILAILWAGWVWLVVVLTKSMDEIDSNHLNWMNRSVDPCDDFYEYSCGNINPKAWGHFHRLSFKEIEFLDGLLKNISDLDDPETRSTKLNYQVCVNILEKKFDVKYFRIFLRDLCVKISGANATNKRIIERLYLENILLDDAKVDQVSKIMKDVQNSLVNLVEQSANPWTKDEGDDWKAKANVIKNSLKKVQLCIGYFKDLLNKGHSSVTLIDESFTRELETRKRENSTDLFDHEDLKDHLSKCYWSVPVFSATAGYNKLGRSIEVPYSLMQAPFFDNQRPSAMNYGAIGAIMGHELAHAIQIDEYQKKNDIGPAPTCIVNQSRNFWETIGTVRKNTSVINETGTLKEDFGDNLGLKAAFSAYQSLSSTEKKKNLIPELKDFTDQQLFFLAFGQMWCSKNPAKRVGSSHSPSKFRVLGTLQNLEDFAIAFNCPKGSPMNPVEKCRLI